MATWTTCRPRKTTARTIRTRKPPTWTSTASPSRTMPTTAGQASREACPRRRQSRGSWVRGSRGVKSRFSSLTESSPGKAPALAVVKATCPLLRLLRPSSPATVSAKSEGPAPGRAGSRRSGLDLRKRRRK